VPEYTLQAIFVSNIVTDKIVFLHPDLLPNILSICSVSLSDTYRIDFAAALETSDDLVQTITAKAVYSVLIGLKPWLTVELLKKADCLIVGFPPE
jgi:hypothetical protein